MENLENESEIFRQVILTKKERFRTEIRKSKNKEEFAMKRMKIMQEKDKQGDSMILSSQQDSLSSKENHQYNQNYTNMINRQRNQKESFFDQFDEEDQLQKDNKSNQIHNNQPLNIIESQLQNQENYLIDEDLYQILQEFKNSYQNGNRKILFSTLCQIRKRIIFASSEEEKMKLQTFQKQQIQQNESNYNMVNKGDMNQHQTISYDNNNRCSVYSIILDDEQFLKIILDILMISDFQQVKEIQIECMWILINLCAGKNKECMIILNLGILDTFKYLLEHCNDFELLEHVCWCLGNLAADDTESRVKLFEDSSLIEIVVTRFYQKIMTYIPGLQSQNNNCQPQDQLVSSLFIQIYDQKYSHKPEQNLLQQNQSHGNFKIVYELVFFLTNLIKKQPMPSIMPLRKILQILKNLFFLDLPQVQVEIVKSFWVFLMKKDTYLQEVQQIDIIRYIIPFLAGQNLNLIKVSLDLFIKIISLCDNFVMSTFVESKFQGYLEKAMCNPSKEIKLKGIQLIQKILECSQGLNIVAEIIYQDILLYKLLNLLVEEEFQIKKSIIILLKVFLESDMGVQKLIKLDYIQILIKIGKCNDSSIEKIVINSLDLIFEYGASVHNYGIPCTYDTPENQVLSIFFQNQGEALLEQLQESQSQEVCDLCNKLIKNYLKD